MAKHKLAAGRMAATSKARDEPRANTRLASVKPGAVNVETQQPESTREGHRESQLSAPHWQDQS